MKGAKIYKIYDNTNGNVYVGSTTMSINERLNLHKSAYKRYLKNEHKYMTSFDIIKNGDYKIELLEELEDCNTKEQLKLKEKEYLLKTVCINKQITGRTRQETCKAYREKNKDIINEKDKQYRKTHYHIINEKHVCECGGYYTTKHKSEHYKTLKHLKFIRN